ncbi:methionine adenosyltransferase [Nitrosospira multiformis]|uniref:Methionine adenosyltransferase n=1 Tax=Nitrosospira multiformis TaxID=1231 RepID=A0A1I0FYY5_9PROT|nr:methionine adenosyltransferase [Nitrosospira multiformis]SET63783.1 methionine adenosyltransferase [Nitrosospira multiformis]
MMKQNFMFTSESVTDGHPDKLCDQVSDAVVDRFLQQDPFSKVIAECAVSTGILFIAARFASSASIDIPEVARRVIHQLGYEQADFNARDCTIMTSLTELPAPSYPFIDEREMSEEELESVTAKNQANVFGFACNQSPAFMPLPISLSHKLARRLTATRFQKQIPYLAPDGKTQVGVEYREGRPYRIHSITIVATQQKTAMRGLAPLHDDLNAHVIEPVFATETLRPDSRTHIFINPEGLVADGGPSLHSGLTGRKNAVDTYGEYSRHSESALSGKDPSRIDRVGAYAARYAAKNVVAAGLAQACEVHLAYSIGISRPVSVQVDTFGTGRIPDTEITARILDHFDFRPAGIIRAFNLRYQPQLFRGLFYRKLAVYGQVGRMDIGLPWESTDKAALLR